MDLRDWRRRAQRECVGLAGLGPELSPRWNYGRIERLMGWQPDHWQPTYCLRAALLYHLR